MRTKGAKDLKPRKPRAVKTSAPKIKEKSINRAIDILKREKLKLETRFNENKRSYSGNIKRGIGIPHYNAVQNPLKAQIDRLEKGIQELSNSKFKPRKDALSIFETLYTTGDKAEARFTGTLLVNDRETNFKNLILNKLQAQGVDIYNPTELNKIFGGEDVDLVIERISIINEGESVYEELSDDAADYIQMAVKDIKKETRMAIKEAERLSQVLNNPFANIVPSMRKI